MSSRSFMKGPPRPPSASVLLLAGILFALAFLLMVSCIMVLVTHYLLWSSYLGLQYSFFGRFVFSACGGIRTGEVTSFWQPTFPCWLKIVLERVHFAVVTPLTGLMGSSTHIYSLSVAVYLTARHWPDFGCYITSNALAITSFSYLYPLMAFT